LDASEAPETFGIPPDVSRNLCGKKDFLGQEDLAHDYCDFQIGGNITVVCRLTYLDDPLIAPDTLSLGNETLGGKSDRLRTGVARDESWVYGEAEPVRLAHVNIEDET
jgi:hypothetical protein